jgi:tetratricopeptide (TPR) repeat protein
MSMPDKRSFLALAASFGLLAGPLAAQTGGMEVGRTSAKDALSQKESRRREAVEHYLRAKLYAQESEFEAAVREFKKAVELDPTDGALRREYGELLRDLPVYPEAEAEARKAVELSPKSAGAHRLLGQVLLATAKDKTRLEAAAVELKAANELAPADPQGAVAYAQVLLRLERPKEASSVLEGVLDRANGPAVLLLYGETLERSDQLQQAEEVYKGLAKLDPENKAALLGLLRVYDRQRQFDKAAPILQSFLKLQPGNLGLKSQYAGLLLRGRRFGEARKVVEEVLAADPGNRDALRLYAALLSETREPDKADEVLRKLQSLEPADLEIPYRRAVNFLEARRVSEAEAVLFELRAALVAKKPDAPEIAQIDGQLAYAAYLRKDYAAATARLEPHLRGEEGLNLQAYNLLLQIARDREDWTSGLRLAKDAYDKAPKKTPMLRANYAEFRLRSASAEDQGEGGRMLEALVAEDKAGTLAAADAWQRLDKYGRAAAAARAGLERDKEDPDLLFRLAASLEREKKVAESVDAFEKLLKVRGDHAPGLNYLGYMWADRGENLPRALELIRKAVELEPGNGAYLDSLGWVYFQLNKLDKAEENLRAAAVLNPDDATVEEHLGDLYEKKGDLALARTSWKRALTLKPDEDVKRRLDEKLLKTEGRDARK